MAYLAEPPVEEPKPVAGESISRRELLLALGGGILVFALAPTAKAQRGEAGRQGGGQVSQQISAWIHIGSDGKIRVFTGKVEVGQNARTSLSQAVAEELRVPTESIEMVMGDTDLCPFDMGTFGSQTTPRMAPQLRRAAAAAREALIDVAAQKMGADRASLHANDGKVTRISASDASALSYGELAKYFPADKAIPADIALTSATEWKVMGKPTHKVTAEAVVTGKHRYAIDHKAEGMLCAKVLRPPSLGAELVSVDTAEAEKLAHVIKDKDFVAVAAPSLRQADRALEGIRAVWKEKRGPSDKDLAAVFAAGPRANSVASAPGRSVVQTYSCPYIAHVPLEPRAALAEWDGQKMTVYTGSQRPFGVKGEVAQALGLDEKQVRVIVPDTGSGYGGKHTGDAAVEAARIAKALGKPIKLQWTRAEEFMFAYFRPAGFANVIAVADGEGKLSQWEFDNFNSGGAGLQTPYEVTDPKQQFHQANSPLRQGSYRALAATFNNFARETAMDELAGGCGIDPLEFRLMNLRNERLKAVLQAAATKFGWGAKPAPGRGFGLACATEKGGFVANAVEVQASKETGQIRVIRAVSAFECGAIVNPLHLQNQVEGAVVQGLGGALFEGIEFENGKILNGSMAKYRVPRYSDVPVLETVLLDRKDLPSAGAGEAGICSIAPAVGNAIFQATGVRLRSMPLRFG